MKDALDIKLIWKKGFFRTFHKILKGKANLKNITINKNNFDDLMLD